MSVQENATNSKGKYETNTNVNEQKSDTNSKISHEYGRMMITKSSVKKIQKIQEKRLKKENSDLLLSSKDNEPNVNLQQEVLSSQPILKVS